MHSHAEGLPALLLQFMRIESCAEDVLPTGAFEFWRGDSLIYFSLAARCALLGAMCRVFFPLLVDVFLVAGRDVSSR